MLKRSASWTLALWLVVASGTRAQAPPDAAPPAQPPPPPALPQVTVEADRVKLEHQVFDFVSNISRAIPRQEALRRWQVPICPLVAGLTRDEGEFLLERLSQIVREVGAPLDKERCAQPNLIIIVSPKPDELLQRWAARRPSPNGPRDSVAGFRRFSTTPRPIRVWYNHSFGSVYAAPVVAGSLQLGASASWGIVSGGFDTVPSRFEVADVLAFSSVAVIVDGRRIVGLEIGQISDYIAMAALTEPDLDAPLGDAPTILRLFSTRSGQPPPAGLTSWDREFLKGLYAMNLDKVSQRSQIASRMVHDLAP